MSAIPPELLAEARDALMALGASLGVGSEVAEFNRLDEALAVLARHCPAPSDRYTAGYTDGVKAAAGTVERAADALIPTNYPRRLIDRVRTLATAIRALAPPAGDVVVGRLRWERDGDLDCWWYAYIGKMEVGAVNAVDDGTWAWSLRFATAHGRAPALEAAQSALVAAVREEMEAPHD